VNKRWALLVVAAVLASACGSADGEPRDSRATPSLPGYAAPGNPSPTGGAEPEGKGALEGLTIELVLAKESVEAGGNVHSDLVVENQSEEVVIDPECYIGGGRFGLVPVDEPNAELWGAIVTDCGGPFRMEPGFKDRFTGPDFRAAGPQGDPLAPGSYLAALDLRGRAERLYVPIQVTE
jgi:hypothetical protein